jgi:hypothetical protein
MPAKSAKQYGLMQGIAHGSITGKAGPSRAVAQEFVNATPAKKKHKFAKALMSKRKGKETS